MLKFNMIFYVTVKTFLFTKHQNEASLVLKLLQRRRRWGAGEACAPPQVLGYQLTLFGPKGADYARHITRGPPPIFLDDAASLY